MAGTGKAVAEEWLRAAGALRERGRLAWALGEALERAWAGGEPGEALGVLEGIVARAVSGVEAARAEACAVEPRAERKAGAVAGDAAGVWRQLQQTDLASRAVPAVWFASGGIGGVRATLALGLKADGGKQVLGVWSGGAGEQRCAQGVCADLRGRGMGRGRAWLAVTEGERALDLALEQQWGQRVVVAHCQETVATAVTGHLPVGQRPDAAARLKAAWESPDAVGARRELSALAQSWQEEHPGAANRLLGECEASTAAAALGVHGGLAQRLRSAAPARHLLGRCLPAARGLAGREAMAAVAGEARAREEAFRRVPERAAVEMLVRLLAQRMEVLSRQG